VASTQNKEVKMASGWDKHKAKIAPKRETVKPCSCGHNRWKTLIKSKLYECRGCGKARNVKEKEGTKSAKTNGLVWKVW
jgi:hypothetical protein